MPVFLVLFLLYTSSIFAASLSPNEEKLSPTQQWEKLTHDRKKLAEKISILSLKRAEYARLAHQKKKDVLRAQEKVTKCFPLLLRIGRTNPLRFLVDLKTTKSSVRGIILLRTVAASLARHMKKAQADLHELIAFITDLNSEKQALEATFRTLYTHQSKLQKEGIRTAEAIKNQEIARLAQVNVHHLLDESHSVLTQTDIFSPHPPPPDNFPFSRLDHPVIGKIVKDPLLQKKFSPQNYGVVFKTEKSATVHAPAKGKVVFKGPFLSQGDILILDHGHDVHTVYMGMDKIKVNMGQDLYAGAKLGSMAGYGKNPPLLYLELRQNGKPIDPFPYLKE